MKRLILTALLVLCLFCTSQAQAAQMPTLNDMLDATCRVSTGYSYGSGTCFYYQHGQYYILTCAHVVGQQSKIRLEFFLDGQKTSYLPGTTVWRKKVSGKPIDFAIVTIHEKYFGAYPPKVIPLVAKEYEIQKGDYIASAGCPSGRWAVAWEGTASKTTTSRIVFHPPPVGGQSGSAVFVMVKNADGEHELRIGALITWRLGSIGSTKNKFGFESAKGGAIPISILYEVLAGKNVRYEHISPIYFREVAKQASGGYAVGNDRQFYRMTFANGKLYSTAPEGVKIVEWGVDVPGTEEEMGLFFNRRRHLFPPKPPVKPNVPLPDDGDSPKPYGNLPDFSVPVELPSVKIDKLENEISTLKRQNTDLATELTEVQAAKVALQEQVASSTAELATLNEQLTTLRGSVDATETTLAEVEGQIVTTTAELEALQVQLANKGIEATQLEQELVDAQAVAQTLELDLTTEQTKTSEANSSATTMTWTSTSLGVILTLILGWLGVGKWRGRLVKGAAKLLDTSVDKVEDAIEGTAATALGDDTAAYLRDKVEGLEDIITSKLESILGLNMSPPVAPTEQVPIDVDAIVQKAVDNAVTKITTQLSAAQPLPKASSTNVTINNTPTTEVAPEPVHIPLTANSPQLQMQIEQLVQISQGRTGTTMEDWALHGSLYKLAVDKLRQGILTYEDTGNPLQGQQRAAKIIDAWVAKEYIRKMTREQLEEQIPLWHHAMEGFLYRQAVERLKMNGFGRILGAKAIANAIESYVEKELLRRAGLPTPLQGR